MYPRNIQDLPTNFQEQPRLGIYHRRHLHVLDSSTSSEEEEEELKEYEGEMARRQQFEAGRVLDCKVIR